MTQTLTGTNWRRDRASVVASPRAKAPAWIDSAWRARRVAGAREPLFQFTAEAIVEIATALRGVRCAGLSMPTRHDDWRFGRGATLVVGGAQTMSVRSSADTYNELMRRRPDLASRLFAEIALDRDGEQGPDESPFRVAPLACWFPSRLRRGGIAPRDVIDDWYAARRTASC